MLKGWRKYAGCLLAAVGIIATACLAGCAEVTSASPHRASGLVAENMQLPAQFKRADGSVETIMLDARVIRPDDDLPHPLLVFNHAYSSSPEEIYVDFVSRSAVEYARRGLVTLAFTRRGNGLSEGEMAQGIDYCSPEEIARFNNKSVEDILEAIRLISLKPYVDKNKIINVGGASGGLMAVALTSHAPPGLIGAISYGGSITMKSDGRKCSEQALVDSMSRLGLTSRVPTLWIYRSNTPKVSQEDGLKMAQSFIRNGGNAEFIAIPAVDRNASFPFEKGSSTWDKYINPFLRKIGVQTEDELISSDRIRVISNFKTN